MSNFSHLTDDGQIKMVNVGEKQSSKRVARAEGYVKLSAKTFALLKEQALPKGDVLTTAKVAGILAAKKTGDLIPLCHPLNLSFVDIKFELQEKENAIRVESIVETVGTTGVEMEAIIAVQIAMSTIYDMCKAVQKDILLKDVRLLFKTGGKSGTFRAP
ncbi:cyclic pyranopterin monophosphate synthase subunit MoaC [Desulfonauticus submarinus]|uniref:Cyclic pyranopterin monophosphate synthase n=1 Tax=Desulfonauticus submarinus TaxID=206665 RepID=A0A1H0B506_9BACT|nr:cyclic pyranopterin monophosphate synthase MoaC [Desulfonauticus submarinus]SDN40711.1 cyclic pyranopterin monophosphate synthase subunit MoaC [Desulfonauticus submarinus]